MIACTRCGYENKPGAKNCWKCGLALKTIASPQQSDLADGLESLAKGAGMLGSAIIKFVFFAILLAGALFCLFSLYR